MREYFIPSTISLIVFLLVSLYIGLTGLGFEYEKLILGGLDDDTLLIFMLILSYIPAFFAGLLSPIFVRGVRLAFKTAFISSVISLILGVLLSVLIGFLLGLDSIYGFALWVAITAPLYFFVGISSILIGYIVLLIMIILSR